MGSSRITHAWVWFIVLELALLLSVTMKPSSAALNPGAYFSAFETKVLQGIHLSETPISSKLEIYFYCCAVGKLWHLKKFLQYTKYIIAEFTHSTILLYTSSPHPGIVSTGLIFPLTYMCTQYLNYIQPPTYFPYIFPHPTGTNPSTSRQGLFCPPVLCFCKKKDIFVCLR
jgi:hypothetical protein